MGEKLGRNTSGFTLIEMILVIIVLGIISATAAPKFIDLTTDARLSALQGLKGALVSANNLVNVKAILSGVERDKFDIVGNDGIDLGGGVMLDTQYGYIRSHGYDIYLSLGMSADSTQWLIPITGYVTEINITPANAPENCYLTYTQATANNPSATIITPPKYSIESSGC